MHLTFITDETCRHCGHHPRLSLRNKHQEMHQRRLLMHLLLLLATPQLQLRRPNKVEIDHKSLLVSAKSGSGEHSVPDCQAYLTLTSLRYPQYCLHREDLVRREAGRK